MIKQSVNQFMWILVGTTRSNKEGLGRGKKPEGERFRGLFFLNIDDSILAALRIFFSGLSCIVRQCLVTH
jgi:hypothetical protein